MKELGDPPSKDASPGRGRHVGTTKDFNEEQRRARIVRRLKIDLKLRRREDAQTTGGRDAELEI